MKMLVLYKEQENLDLVIFNNVECISGTNINIKDFVVELSLATFIEIGEFSCETEKEKMLGEYVDVLHFLLSLNNSFKLQFKENDDFIDLYNQANCTSKYSSSNIPSAAERIVAFIVAYSAFINATRCFKYWSTKESESVDTLRELFDDVLIMFFKLGTFSGFEAKEVLNAYIDKRSINFKRQIEGY